GANRDQRTQDGADVGDAGSHTGVLRAHRQGQPPDAQGGDQPLQGRRSRGRPGAQEARGEEPQAGGERREALPRDGPALRGSDSGGQRRPHAGGGEVRPRPRVEVLYVRDVVDPPGRPARRRRQGPHHPRPRPHGRQDPEDGPRLQRALRAAHPRADRRRGRQEARVDRGRGARRQERHARCHEPQPAALFRRRRLGARRAHRGRAGRRGRRRRDRGHRARFAQGGRRAPARQAPARPDPPLRTRRPRHRDAGRAQRRARHLPRARPPAPARGRADARQRRVRPGPPRSGV
ncbi:MAG: RNA polymerase sigma factor RpoD, partial [uncultured Rubrobacteraceae bacterium]